MQGKGVKRDPKGPFSCPRFFASQVHPMMTAFYLIASFSNALLLGGMVLFSFVIAPLVFIQLPTDIAGRFIRAIFPWYYLYVITTAAVTALTLAPSLVSEPLAMGGVALAGLYTRQILMPEINRLRDAQLAGDKPAGAAFAFRHRLSVVINFLQLFTAAAVLVSLHLAA